MDGVFLYDQNMRPIEILYRDGRKVILKKIIDCNDFYEVKSLEKWEKAFDEL
jgi:uncharacterized Fe-S cluster-containing radical SAM superfamily enzyme